MATLLVVHHSPTRSLRALTDAVLAGAHDDAIEGVEVVVRAGARGDRATTCWPPTATCSARRRTSAT